MRRSWLLLALSLACCNEKPAPAVRPQPSTAAPTAPAPFVPQRLELSSEAMGTKIHFITHTTAALPEVALRAAFDAASAEIRRIESLMTTWRADSELSQVNANPGQWRDISRETLEVFQKSRWASDISGGAFDVTFHALNDVWKFGDAAEAVPKLPDDKLIRSRLALVDYRRVELDATGKVRIAKGTSVDFGGIAKGYAVDKAARVLNQRGLHSFLLQAGGDLYGAGKKPDGSPWTSGIRDPRSKTEDFFATIELQDHAFSTAGDYARSFVLSGKRYHHIIDPKTGYPATGCRSVTVWAKDAFTADALDDAVFIMGPEQGLKLLESQPDVGAVIVDAKNKVWVSERLSGKVKILRQPTDAI